MEFGGYDVEPIDALQQDFYCIVCKLLIKEAMQTRCGHVLCKGCLEKLKDSCREKYISFFIAYFTISYNIDYAYVVYISVLAFKCRNT